MRDEGAPVPLSLLEAVLLPLVEQVRLRRSQVHDLRAAVPIFLHLRTFATIIGIGNPRTPTNDAPPLVTPVVALVADPHQSTGPYVRVADDTFPVALFAEASNSNSRLLAAHYQIGMVFRHGGVLLHCGLATHYSAGAGAYDARARVCCGGRGGRRCALLWSSAAVRRQRQPVVVAVASRKRASAALRARLPCTRAQASLRLN